MNLARSLGESDFRLSQSLLWTEIPLPFVMKPMISSPGTGLQQRAILIIRLSTPSTITPDLSLTFFLSACSARLAVLSLISFSPDSRLPDLSSSSFFASFSNPQRRFRTLLCRLPPLLSCVYSSSVFLYPRALTALLTKAFLSRSLGS